MNADEMAEAAEREIENLKGTHEERTKRFQEKVREETEDKEHTPDSIGFKWNGLISAVNSVTTNVTAKSFKKGKYVGITTTAFNGFDTLTVGGSIYQTDDSPLLKDAHTNKGICQESYDQGYEDGLKAAKEGDTRIK